MNGICTKRNCRARMLRLRRAAKELYRPLTGQERDTALRCMSAMLSARSLEDSVQEALHSLGAYYRADRAYVLKLAEERQVVTMPYEWTSRKKRSIQQAVSGMMLDRFPLLKRCMGERAPVFLSRSPAFASDEAGRVWHYTAVPLMHQEEVAGFLCIENAREHAEDAALCSMLAPYLMQERERYKKEGRAVEAESLLNLPNLRSYLEAAGQLDSDHYGSMGVVCMDVPNLSAINSSLASPMAASFCNMWCARLRTFLARSGFSARGIAHSWRCLPISCARPLWAAMPACARRFSAAIPKRCA